MILGTNCWQRVIDEHRHDRLSAAGAGGGGRTRRRRGQRPPDPIVCNVRGQLSERLTHVALGEIARETGNLPIYYGGRATF